MDRPYEWDYHLTTWVALLLLVTVIVLGHRYLLRVNDHPIRWTRHDIGIFAAACGASVLALTWPLADLAAHWSLTALVSQRLILMLAVAPMLLLGLPYDLLERSTRPALIDAALSRCQRPAVAIGFVTVVTVASATPPLVQAQASSFVVRGLLAVLTVVAGLVLWIPALGRVPGIPRLRPTARLGYLAAQALIPVFLSFVLILYPHPLYSTFAGSHAAIDLRPLNDQQIAGFLAKLTMLIVLLTVGGVGLVKSSTSEEESSLDERLVWADVQRQFERADRLIPEEARGSPPVTTVSRTPLAARPHIGDDNSQAIQDPSEPPATSGDTTDGDDLK
jgi:cytochrome c oxidase assembly factor CtaG